MSANHVGRASTSPSALSRREKQFASLIWRHGQLSRREIQRLTGVHPTLTGTAVGTLIQHKLVREAAIPPTAGRGRPQIPVEIDPDGSRFLGLAIAPGAVRVAVLDPTGRQRGEEWTRRVSKSTSVVQAASDALQQHLDKSIHSIGVSFTGLLDLKSRQLLFSSSQPTRSAVSLQPIFNAAHGRTIVLQNDMHGLAMRWLLTSNAPAVHAPAANTSTASAPAANAPAASAPAARAPASKVFSAKVRSTKVSNARVPAGDGRADEHLAGDVLLVGVDDGRLGASLLVGGQPQHSSISAANELGHMRLAVDTDACYCGQRGCLERIVSTSQLKRFGAKTGRSLDDVLQRPGRDRAAADRLLGHFTTGLANAINFAKPGKLVISSPLARHLSMRDFLQKKLPEKILPGLRNRVEILFWEQASVQSAENAAWLALAEVFGHSA